MSIIKSKYKRLLVCTVVALTSMLLSFSVNAQPSDSADIILTNAQIWTGEKQQPWAEAVAVRGDKIVYVGTDEGAQVLKGPETKVVNLKGQLVTPGFIDSHAHVTDGADLVMQANVAVPTLAGMQKNIKEYAAAHPNKQWIVGNGWWYAAFPGNSPTKEQLDIAISDRPAFMFGSDGHSGWVNSKALEVLGITKDTKDPENGVIVRDPKTGEPTGALKEKAVSYVQDRLPANDPEETYQGWMKVMQLFNAKGITSVCDASSPFGPAAAEYFIPIIDRSIKDGTMNIRLTKAVRLSPTENVDSVVDAAVRLQAKYNSNLFRYGTAKTWLDGVVEQGTAAVISPYIKNDSTGHANWAQEALNDAVIKADKAGLQIYMHAIGDRGVNMGLNAYEAAIKVNGPKERHHRIEHAELISEKDLQRFKEIGVVASMMPAHAYPNEDTLLPRAEYLGEERNNQSFRWQDFEQKEIPMIFGSDWPTATNDVLPALYIATTRKTPEGTPKGGWEPQECISLDNAMRHYTIGAAHANSQADITGSIKVGKLADMVVLSKNIFTGNPEKILDAKVNMTIIGGRVVYQVDPIEINGHVIANYRHDKIDGNKDNVGKTTFVLNAKTNIAENVDMFARVGAQGVTNQGSIVNYRDFVKDRKGDAGLDQFGVIYTNNDRFTFKLGRQDAVIGATNLIFANYKNIGDHSFIDGLKITGKSGEISLEALVGHDGMPANKDGRICSLHASVSPSEKWTFGATLVKNYDDNSDNLVPSGIFKAFDITYNLGKASFVSEFAKSDAANNNKAQVFNINYAFNEQNVASVYFHRVEQKSNICTDFWPNEKGIFYSFNHKFSPTTDLTLNYKTNKYIDRDISEGATNAACFEAILNYTF